MATVTEEQILIHDEEAPLVDVGFDPETIDGRGEIKEEE